MWYRVFGSNARMPESHGHPGVFGRFVCVRLRRVRGGRIRLVSRDLLVDGVPLQLERYLATEEGIRAELNSWAAWLETRENAAEHVHLMERMIQTPQLFTLRSGEESAESGSNDVLACVVPRGFTAGVYQIDGRGFFAADGRLLVLE